ncbi:hypothetical protein NA56DRAFT_716665 [Hyaloscypha hepaticicola]|uniref:Uncharacterized protein n=1 Tax=Hyaloscypha hepaticicola TaxID=2082293 RepID=A0A2J6QCF3_9HELO|nr:hypothetical protein NA56DRAFT_716665 [Hyaloscypha hepaticicola]
MQHTTRDNPVFEVTAEVQSVPCTGPGGGDSPDLHQALSVRRYGNPKEARRSWSAGVLESCLGTASRRKERGAHCAECAATAVAIASACLLASASAAALYRKLHFSDGPPILVACRLSVFQKDARALHHFVAALGKLWQRLAARETQGPAPVPQGRPGRASATIPPPPPRRRHNRTIFPPYGLKDPSSGNLAHGGGRIFPRGHMYF